MTDFSMRWAFRRGQCYYVCYRCEPICPRPVTNADYPALEKLADGAIKEKQKFERLVVSKENLLEMFGVCPRLLLKA